MKRYISIILALVMTFTLCACSSSTTNNADSSTEDQEFVFEKNITLIVPSNETSSMARYAQKFSEIAEKYVDVNFTLEYVTGATGKVAITTMLAKESDGYTIELSSSAQECAIAADNALSFSENDFVVPAVLLAEPYTIAVQPDSPFQSVGDVIQYAKENPGKLNWGAASIMGVHHFFALNFAKFNDIEMNYIPYDSAGDSLIALLGGNVDLACGVAGSVLPYVESGEMRMLATGLSDRDPAMPDVPTVYEGMNTTVDEFGLVYCTDRILIMNADTDEDVLAAWDKLIAQVVADEDWAPFAESMGALASEFKARDKATPYVRDNIATYRTICANIAE